MCKLQPQEDDVSIRILGLTFILQPRLLGLGFFIFRIFKFMLKIQFFPIVFSFIVNKRNQHISLKK